jgi:putative transposase
MSEKYRIFKGGTFFVTLTVVGWIDFFTRYEYCDEIIKNLNYCIDNKGLRVYAIVIMPSHIHMIASAEEGTLGDILRDFKSFTAKELIKKVQNSNTESRREWLLYLFRYFAKSQKHNAEFQFWQQHNHPIDLYSVEMVEQKLNYIYQNPVKARIVDEPEQYVYSSANRFCQVKLNPI